MSNTQLPDRGKLFENTEKRKPSQPDLQGDCSIDGKTYDVLAWRREDQLTISFAPPRGDKNSYQTEAFKGVLNEEEREKASGRGANKAVAPIVWSGDIKGEDASYTVKAVEKQGKSGAYFTLSFEPLSKID